MASPEDKQLNACNGTVTNATLRDISEQGDNNIPGKINRKVKEVSVIEQACSGLDGITDDHHEQMKVSSTSMNNDRDSDNIQWKNRCIVLESSLQKFRVKAIEIRKTLAKKMSELQERSAESESRAESSEHQLKLMEQRLAAINWQPQETDLKLQELESACHDRDRLIGDLEKQLTDQRRQREFDAQLVEAKANRIKDWVSSKLRELELQNNELRAENHVLHSQVDLLHDRLHIMSPAISREIYRTSLQESHSRHSSRSSLPVSEVPVRPMELPPLALAVSIGDRGEVLSDDSQSHGSDEEEEEEHLQNSHSSSEEDEDEQDVDDGVVRMEADSYYHEVDSNHESKYEPKRSFPPQVKIERKAYLPDARMMESFVSSSNGSEEVLHRSRTYSRASSGISDKLDDCQAEIEGEECETYDNNNNNNNDNDNDNDDDDDEEEDDDDDIEVCVDDLEDDTLDDNDGDEDDEIVLLEDVPDIDTKLPFLPSPPPCTPTHQGVTSVDAGNITCNSITSAVNEMLNGMAEISSLPPTKKEKFIPPPLQFLTPIPPPQANNILYQHPEIAVPVSAFERQGFVSPSVSQSDTANVNPKRHRHLHITDNHLSLSKPINNDGDTVCSSVASNETMGSKSSSMVPRKPASWESRIYAMANKGLKSKQEHQAPVSSPSGAEPESTQHLFTDVTVPVFATLRGKATKIRTTPFTEESTSESSDDEGGNTTPTSVNQHPVTITTTVTSRESEPVCAGGGGSYARTTTKLANNISPMQAPQHILVNGLTPPVNKRGVSGHSMSSETSSDYALPPDEISTKSDSEYSEPEQKLHKCTDDISKYDTLDRCGYLSKLGGKVKIWKRRWFVLRNGELCYYKGQMDVLRKPQGQIVLDHQTKISRSHGELTFEITNSKRTYYLSADSPAEMERWIRAVKKTLKRQVSHLPSDYCDSSVVLKGWMTKVKNGVTRRCWCVLMGRHFVYYKSPSHKTPVGEINLRDAKLEEIDKVCDSDEEYESNNAQKFTLVIWPAYQGPTYLILPSKQEKDSWMYHLTVSAGGGTGNVGTEYEQLVSKLMEVNGDTASVFWKHPVLLHCKEPLNRPLTTLPSEDLQQQTVHLYKSIQSFILTSTDSSPFEYHVDLAQSILDTCLQHTELQNELISYIIKQTSKHPKLHKTPVQNLLLCGKHSCFLCNSSTHSHKSSLLELSDSKLNPTTCVIIQAWQLLAMAVALFVPKQSVMWLLRIHLQRNADHKSDVGKYALFCQQTLERTILKGNREARPSRMEVLSVLLSNPYQHSQPLSIPVHFVNGNYQVVSFDGSTTVQEFLHSLNKCLGLRDCGHSGFSLFTNNPGGHEIEHCLQLSVKICDVISRWEQAYKKSNVAGKLDPNATIRLLYKNRLYFRSACKYESEREKVLQAYQISDEIVNGRFPLNKDLALELASLMAQIEYGDVRASSLHVDIGAASSSHSVPPQLELVINRFYPKHYKSHDPEAEKHLIQTLAERWQALKGRTGQDCVRIYLTVARKWPYCGSKLVPAKLKTNDEAVWIAVHEDGVSVLEKSTMQAMNTYDFKSVVTFGGWQSDFMVVVNQLIESAPHHYEHSTERVLFIMDDAKILEITLLIASYINNRIQSSPDGSAES